MTRTILPKKATVERPIAADDTHFDTLSRDPSISQFPQGVTHDSYNEGSFNAPSFNQQSQHNFGSTSNINQSNSAQPVLTGASATNAASGADVLVANTNSDWINKKWRPAMGWSYMLTCITDFVIFPILWSLLQALSKGQVTSQWQPLTLQGAGLYHIAMGAVLGIAAYGRTKEKIEGAAKN